MDDQGNLVMTSDDEDRWSLKSNGARMTVEDEEVGSDDNGASEETSSLAFIRQCKER